MATTQPLTLTPSQILNNLIETVKAGLIKAGVDNPQVDNNSDFYIISTALSNQLGIGNQMISAQANAQMADTATGDDLDRIAGIYGLTRRPAIGGSGYIAVAAPSGTISNVPVGSQLTSSQGLVYQIVTGKTDTANGDYLEVVAIDTGLQTNLAINHVLTWQNAPGFLTSSATVSIAITGGSDQENDTQFRNRLLGILQNPPQYGNWSQIAKTATDATSLIEAAYVYPCANGPGTQYIVFTKAQSTVSIANRGITVNSAEWIHASTAITSSAPAYVQTVIPWSVNDANGDGYLSVTNIANDISIQLDIPYPVGAQNNGIGGGWVDFTPWPNVANNVGSPTTGYFAYVSVVPLDSNGTQFTVRAATGIDSSSTLIADPSLVAGITHISWIDKSNINNQGWVVTSSTVVSFRVNTITSNYTDYEVTIDNPFPTIVVGDYIFPTSVNEQSYLDIILASFANLGPGQISSVGALFPNAYRQPLVQLTNPDVVDGRFLRSLVDSTSEVEAAQFFYNESGSPTTVKSIYGTEPTVPSTIPSAGGTKNVGIYVPGQIGWYPVLGSNISGGIS